LTRPGKPVTIGLNAYIKPLGMLLPSIRLVMLNTQTDKSFFQKTRSGLWLHFDHCIQFGPWEAQGV